MYLNGCIEEYFLNQSNKYLDLFLKLIIIVVIGNPTRTLDLTVTLLRLVSEGFHPFQRRFNEP